MEIDIQPIIAAAKAGGKVIAGYFGEVLEVEEKLNPTDLRTKADTESEEVILSTLRQAYPNFNIYSEEAGHTDNNSDYTFVVDPLDGSNNFVLGVPNFTVSIALLKGDEIISGVIYSPILGHTYYAEKGKGAYRDGVQIHVNQQSEIRRATVSYICGYVKSREYTEKVTHNLNQYEIKRQIDNWSPAFDYCLLASGKIEGVINNKCDFYDFAAGKILVAEAGGLVTGFQGEPLNDRADVFIASNGTAVHQNLIDAL